MFRETDAGLRHYVKEGDVRVISESQTSQVKAMAMGVYVDPSYAFPLPIFGINYLNFSLGGSENDAVGAALRRCARCRQRPAAKARLDPPGREP